MASSTAVPTTPSSVVLDVSFNQDLTCFSLATTDGFTVFTTNPLSQTLTRNFKTYNNQSLRTIHATIVRMLYRSNIFALVSKRKVMIWDDHMSACNGELSFRSEVKSVRLTKDRVVAVLLHKVYVYDVADLSLLHEVETEANPRGLCEVSHKSEMVMVCLGPVRGQVRVGRYNNELSSSRSSSTKLIMAHESGVACVALASDGRYAATASCKGTLVRVFNTLDGTLLQELRRGSERAEIYSLCFSPAAQWLAVSSDKGTVHVFGLKTGSGSSGTSGSLAAETNNATLAATSRFPFIKGLLPKYFSSEWSVAQFRVQEGLKHIVGFGHQKNTLVVIGFDGRFYRCKFDPVNGGEMSLLEHHNILHPE